MREFRAWHKNHKQMLYPGKSWGGPDVYISLDGRPCAEGDSGTMRHPEPYFPWYLDEFIILMEFTGLNDKDGVKIYKSDIVKNNWHNINGVFIGNNWVVEFGHHDTSDDYYASQAYGFYYKSGIKEHSLSYLPTDNNDGIEKIGNIYENPELLEEKDKNRNRKRLV